MKNVLIAHQSTIPHYRVPFYNAMEKLRPHSWRFDVVFDTSELRNPIFFKEPPDRETFQFPILETRTLTTKVKGKRVSYQTFWRQATTYDLVVVGNTVNNLTYPLCHLHQLRGTKIAYWGHGKDRNADRNSVPKLVAEKTKILLARKADGFFAYTPKVKAFLESQGVSPDKVFSVNNTIDILRQRALFEKYKPQQERIRQDLNLCGKKVLLFVGRATWDKRLDFLLESFAILQRNDKDFCLLMVGSGTEPMSSTQPDNTRVFGFIDTEELAQICVASDVLAFPGTVGLGPLQVLCYDLPVITIDAVNQKPEFEYLSLQNSLVLDSGTTPDQYAQAIIDLFQNPTRLRDLQHSVWSSIQHLTVEQMAQNFINGINTILDVS